MKSNKEQRAPRKCALCGNEFVPKHVDSRFCCVKCYRKHYQRTHRDVFCRISKKWRENNPEAMKRMRERIAERKRGKIVEKACPQCGTVFMPKSRRQKFCCNKCAMRHSVEGRMDKIRENSRKYYWQRKSDKVALEPRVCPVCGVSFQPKQTNSVCCSRVCSKKMSRAKHKEHAAAYNREYRKTHKPKPREFYTIISPDGGGCFTSKSWPGARSADASSDGRAESTSAVRGIATTSSEA